MKKFKIAIICLMLLSLVITVLSAFAFARLEFKGRDSMFAFMLATMMIPGELFQITNLITIMRLEWQNSFIVLIVPFLVSIFYIYLLYLHTIPIYITGLKQYAK